MIRFSLPGRPCPRPPTAGVRLMEKTGLPTVNLLSHCAGHSGPRSVPSSLRQARDPVRSLDCASIIFKTFRSARPDPAPACCHTRTVSISGLSMPLVSARRCVVVDKAKDRLTYVEYRTVGIASVHLSLKLDGRKRPKHRCKSSWRSCISSCIVRGRISEVTTIAAWRCRIGDAKESADAAIVLSERCALRRLVDNRLLL